MAGEVNGEIHPARRIWTILEPLHDVVYFAPGVRDAGVSIGLKGFWMTYFAFRAAPLGAVGAGTAVATFANFQPGMVAKALPGAWSHATPEQCLRARLSVSGEALRAVGVNADACAKAVELLAPAVARADPTGRPLFAANAELGLPTEPVAALWQLATALREHRGDGHIALLLANGITGLESHLLQVANGRFPGEQLRSVRGWSAEEWAAAADGLRARGLLDVHDGLTEAGTELLGAIEARTDDVAWQSALASLGTDGAAAVAEVLQPSVDALWSSGILPEVNPTGLKPR